MIFEKDFIDFIDLLNIQNVEYMVVDAHALAFHGRPRHTGDLDIWIKPSFDNAKKWLMFLKTSDLGLLVLRSMIF
jgi:hypothetical protein